MHAPRNHRIELPNDSLCAFFPLMSGAAPRRLEVILSYDSLEKF